MTEQATNNDNVSPTNNVVIDRELSRPSPNRRSSALTKTRTFTAVKFIHPSQFQQGEINTLNDVVNAHNAIKSISDSTKTSNQVGSTVLGGSNPYSTSFSKKGNYIDDPRTARNSTMTSTFEKNGFNRNNKKNPQHIKYDSYLEKQRLNANQFGQTSNKSANTITESQKFLQEHGEYLQQLQKDGVVTSRQGVQFIDLQKLSYATTIEEQKIKYRRADAVSNAQNTLYQLNRFPDADPLHMGALTNVQPFIDRTTEDPNNYLSQTAPSLNGPMIIDPVLQEIHAPKQGPNLLFTDITELGPMSNTNSRDKRILNAYNTGTILLQNRLAGELGELTKKRMTEGINDPNNLISRVTVATQDKLAQRGDGNRVQLEETELDTINYVKKLDGKRKHQLFNTPPIVFDASSDFKENGVIADFRDNPTFASAANVVPTSETNVNQFGETRNKKVQFISDAISNINNAKKNNIVLFNPPSVGDENSSTTTSSVLPSFTIDPMRKLHSFDSPNLTQGSGLLGMSKQTSSFLSHKHKLNTTQMFNMNDTTIRSFSDKEAQGVRNENNGIISMTVNQNKETIAVVV